jgi:thiol:disulfide interchange protein
MKNKIYSVFIALFLLSTCLLQAESNIDPIRFELLVEQESFVADQPLWVAVKMDIDENWHAYWKNPGEAGMAPEITWDLPEGFSVADEAWPYPLRFQEEFGESYGYKGTQYFLSQITVPKNLKGKENLTIKAHVDWLVCGESCIPGQSSLSKTVPSSKGPSIPNPAHNSAFSKAWASIPKATPLTIERKKHDIVVTLPNTAGKEIKDAFFFFQNADLTLDPVEQNLLSTAGGSVLKISGKHLESVDLKDLEGVLVLNASTGQTEAITVSPQTGTHQAVGDVTASKTSMTLALALVMAFAGGLLLNLMPCVLPVIAIKVMSFIKLAGENRWTSLKHGLAFFAGALLSFWVLAAVLLVFRSYGETLGWGFQLQSPLFVGILALALFVFALNLFGVFEMGASISSAAGKANTSRMGLLGSFSSGILATAVATPCTGPFLGVTLGFAVTLSVPEAMLIFTMMGVGMAIPYVILAAFPSLMRFLPKPGPWMITFKELMGFLILATVLWLVWVFSAQTDSMGVVVLLLAFMIASIGGWIYGKWGSALSKRRLRTFSSILSIAALALSAFTVVQASQFLSSDEQTSTGSSEWLAYSPEKLKELRAQETPVFIDFTAKWCLICQANKLVLNGGEIADHFNLCGIVKMRGDWTKNNPVITEALKKHNRTGVPLYLLYDGKADSEPHVLPQVLTSDLIVSYLDEMHSCKSHLAENETETTDAKNLK